MSNPSKEAQYINALILHDHEVGRANSPPKLLKLENFWNWKNRFESFIRLTDVNMWMMITEGYEWPTHDDPTGVTVKYKYGDMSETLKKEYATEGKALSTIKMCLPSDSIHLFQDCTLSKELWDALTREMRI